MLAHNELTEDDIDNETDKHILLKWKLEIQNDCGIIKNEIEEAKRCDEYSDVDWFNRINVKRRILSHLTQKIQFRLGFLRDEQKELNKTASDNRDVNRNAIFIEAAKIVLDKSTYLKIWEMAGTMGFE